MSEVLSLDSLSCPHLRNILKEREGREKKEVGDRPAKLNEKKSERELEGQKKSKKYIFLLEKQHDNFVAAVRK